MQTASFVKVEGRSYSSVMVTGNLRYSVETFFAGCIEKHDPAALRQSRILVIVCVTFALGAALGAILTNTIGSRALLVPIVLLFAALVLCTRDRNSDRRMESHHGSSERQPDPVLTSKVMFDAMMPAAMAVRAEEDGVKKRRQIR